MATKLLIAEDDDFIRAMIAEFLRDVGYDVSEAQNADEAIAVLESGAAIDLLFSDIRMPGTMNGWELARCVHERWPNTRVILTSGDLHALAEVRHVTSDPILEKPYRPLSMLTAIQAVAEP